MTDIYYNYHAKEYYKNTVNIDMSAIYSRFLKHLPPKCHILDAGCGFGRDTDYFLKSGYQVDAFDKSEEMVKLSKRHTKLDIKQMAFCDLQEIKKYDAVWACASLIHLPEQDLDHALINLSRSLKDGGIIYMSFKYEGSPVIDEYDRHFFNQNKKTAQTLVDTTKDLEVLEIWKKARD